MINIKLDKIKLQDFQNWKLLEIDFNETKSLQANYGYGKTTIYNAFLYALGDSNIKPKPINHTLILPDSIVSSVELNLTIDGEPYTFIRNSNNKFQINDTKITTLNKYINTINSILNIDSETLALLVKCGKFNEDTSKWKWNDRRNFLFNYFGVNDLLKDLESHYDLLQDDFNAFTYAEIETSFSTTTKTLNKQKSMLNDMLQDNVAKLNAYSSTQEKELKDQLDYYNNLLNEYKTTNTAQEILNKETAIKTIQSDTQLKIDNLQNQKLNEFNTTVNKITTIQTQYQDLISSQAVLQTNLSKLDKELVDIINRTFEPETVCKYCGSVISQDKINDNMASFEKAKEEDFEKANTQYLKLQGELDRLSGVKITLEKHLKSLEAIKNNIKSTLDIDIKAINSQATESINALKEEIENLKSKSNCNIDTIQANILDLSLQLANFNSKSVIEDTIQELKTKIRAIAELERNNAIKKEQFLDFIDKSRAIVNKGINDNFNDRISFKLFNRKSDGSYENECITLLDGKPYENLSFGEKILADFLLIKYLQQSYNMKLPIFIDNANAFTEIKDTNYQIISLITTINQEPNFSGIKLNQFYDRKEVN